MPHCIEHTNLMEFFRERVREAIRHQGKETPEAVEFYLVNLLQEFSKSEKIASSGEALALKFAKALEVGPNDRIPILKHLGDLSLYISGFFPHSFSHKIVDIDYYVQMGETAYGALSQLMERRSHFPEVFTHLSDRFVEVMDILAEVSEQGVAKNDADLLRLYEMWMKTGSQRTFNILSEEGIIPVRFSAKLQ